MLIVMLRKVLLQSHSRSFDAGMVDFPGMKLNRLWKSIWGNCPSRFISILIQTTLRYERYKATVIFRHVMRSMAMHPIEAASQQASIHLAVNWVGVMFEPPAETIRRHSSFPVIGAYRYLSFTLWIREKLRGDQLYNKSYHIIL